MTNNPPNPDESTVLTAEDFDALDTLLDDLRTRDDETPVSYTHLDVYKRQLLDMGHKNPLICRKSREKTAPGLKAFKNLPLV